MHIAKETSGVVCTLISDYYIVYRNLIIIEMRRQRTVPCLLEIYNGNEPISKVYTTS